MLPTCLLILFALSLSESSPIDRAVHPRSVKTVRTPSGQLIDWIPIDAQGSVASIPAPLIDIANNTFSTTSQALKPLSEIQEDPSLQGPPGTVPVAQPLFSTLDDSYLHAKQPPPTADTISRTKRESDVHWYASTDTALNLHGAQARYSLFNPYVQPRDFTLIQTALIRSRGAGTQGSGQQTIESGWCKWPSGFNDATRPHLFTFYTTNGYSQYGGGLQSWNTDFSGWVQVDSQIHPGSIFSTMSSDNGAQYDLYLAFQLIDGNWWLWALDRWIGYYPGSLFSNGRYPADTLSNFADHVNFYGEIYDAASSPGVTTTDMGSGNWPETGFGRAAYIRNIGTLGYESGAQWAGYNAQGRIVSDEGRYRLQTHYNSGSDFGSWIALGGPGAGGQVGS